MQRLWLNIIRVRHDGPRHLVECWLKIIYIVDRGKNLSGRCYLKLNNISSAYRERFDFNIVNKLFFFLQPKKKKKKKKGELFILLVIETLILCYVYHNLHPCKWNSSFPRFSIKVENIYQPWFESIFGSQSSALDRMSRSVGHYSSWAHLKRMMYRIEMCFLKY